MSKKVANIFEKLNKMLMEILDTNPNTEPRNNTMITQTVAQDFNMESYSQLDSSIFKHYTGQSGGTTFLCIVSPCSVIVHSRNGVFAFDLYKVNGKQTLTFLTLSEVLQCFPQHVEGSFYCAGNWHLVAEDWAYCVASYILLMEDL